MHEELVEAIAWWRAGTADGRRVLVDAAIEALLEGAESAALAELAGLPGDENPYAVDAVVSRVLEDLRLRDALGVDTDLIAARRLCRAVLTGATSERELTRWVHTHFHHESSSDLINQLAELDDDFDLAASVRGSTSEVSARVREVAAQVADRA